MLDNNLCVCVSLCALLCMSVCVCARACARVKPLPSRDALFKMLL